MLKVGVVGIGHMGRYHVNILSIISKAELAAVCDSDAEAVKKTSEAYNIKGYTDYDEFLDQVDAVIVAVPTFLHFKFASRALEKGKHVLVEKPITETISDAEKLIEMAEKKDLFLQVGHVERFNAAVQELEHIVKNPYLIQAQRLGPRSRIVDVGVVLDLMIHDVDIILAIAGAPVKEITAYGKKIYSNHEDLANVSLLFENGVIANIAASRVTDNKVRTLSISQEGSFVLLDYATQDITIFRQPHTEYLVMREEIKYTQESIVERMFVHKDNALKLELEHFIECVSEGREPDYHSEADISALKLATEITKRIYEKGI
ncbi:MAG: Gfo/Idh/MocA family oxidoreductase [Brevinematales bacterium]|nr:Gfo/Idh/MocA family oxidoreductase [Brevinematales bacterium]